MEWTLGKYDIGQVTTPLDLSSHTCFLSVDGMISESFSSSSNYMQIILNEKYFIYVCVCIYMWYMSVCVCIYTHTQTHTNTLELNNIITWKKKEGRLGESK